MHLELGENTRLGIWGYQTLSNPEVGFLAGLPRYNTHFPRDDHRFNFMAYSVPDNAFLPGILETSLAGLHLQSINQGIKSDQKTGETPGAIFHERRVEKPIGIHSDGTFMYDTQSRLLLLEKNGWYTETAADGTKTQLHFVGQDITGSYLQNLATLARMKAYVSGDLSQQDKLIEKYWMNALAAYKNQTSVYSDGKGLICYTPTDPHTLRHQCERDQNSTYLQPNGKEPEPPFWHAGNNAWYLEGMKQTVWMASRMEDASLIKEAAEIYTAGVQRYRKLFWREDIQYPTPLVYSPNMHQADTINDEALDGMALGIWTKEQNDAIAYRVMQPDLNHPYGFWGVSRLSPVFAKKNDAEAYWRGRGSWPHRLGIASIAFKNGGYPKLQKIVEEQFRRVTSSEGLKELVCVNDDFSLEDYMEDGNPSACNPQLFPSGAALAIDPVKRNGKELVEQTDRSENSIQFQLQIGSI